ncbi:MAG: hypothetical protein ACRC0F_10265 [Cetobacterium sp.]
MSKNKEIKELEIKVSVSGAEKARQSVEKLNKAYKDAEAKIKQAELKEERIKNRSNANYYKSGGPGKNAYKSRGIASEAERIRNIRINSEEFKQMEKLFNLQRKVNERTKLSAAKASNSRKNREMSKKFHTEQQFRDLGVVPEYDYNGALSQKSILAKNKVQGSIDKQREKLSKPHMESQYMKYVSKQFESRMSTQQGKAVINKQQFDNSSNIKAMRDYYTELEKQSGADLSKAISEAFSEDKARSRAKVESEKAEKTRKANMAKTMSEAISEDKMRSKSITDNISNIKSNKEKMGKAFDKYVQSTKGFVGSITSTFTEMFGVLAMVAGSVMMAIGIFTAIVKSVISLGDAFASIEGDLFAYYGFRASLDSNGKDKFNKANKTHMALTGLDEYSSGGITARRASEWKENGGSIAGNSLDNIAVAAQGGAYLTGKKNEEMASAVMKVAKEGKGADKIGLAGLKLTKNLDANMELIANAYKNNPIAGTLLRRGTVASGVNKVKGAGRQLLGNVTSESQAQLSRMWNGLGDKIMGVANDKEVVYAWRRALSNFEEVIDKVFTSERMKKVALVGAEWAAEFSVIGGNIISSLFDLVENKDETMNKIDMLWSVFSKAMAFKVFLSGMAFLKDTKDFYKAAVEWANSIGLIDDSAKKILQFDIGATIVAFFKNIGAQIVLGVGMVLDAGNALIMGMITKILSYLPAWATGPAMMALGVVTKNPYQAQSLMEGVLLTGVNSGYDPEKIKMLNKEREQQKKDYDAINSEERAIAYINRYGKEKKYIGQGFFENDANGYVNMPSVNRAENPDSQVLVLGGFGGLKLSSDIEMVKAVTGGGF